MQHEFKPDRDFALQLDRDDPLASFRERFFLNEGEIYMDGNSLGLCSRDVEDEVLHVLSLWKAHGISIWNVEDGKYFRYPSYLGGLIAPLIGAKPAEVTVTNSTTINIHQCIATFYEPTPTRYKILVDDLNFSSDRHAVDSQVRLHGYTPEDAVKEVNSSNGRTIDEGEVIDAMTDDVALILLPAVLYRSAQLLDMPRITAAARARGITIGWDLCHSIGAVAHELSDIGADFAVWCNYKYLSAGPGAIGGLYINERHFGRRPGLAGWQGNVKETMFKLRYEHTPSPDADGFLTGTPPLLSMAGLEGVLRIYAQAGMERIREKSLNMTAYMMYLIEQRLERYGYSIGNPREDEKRGGHVSLEHKEAYRICLALKARGVIPDFREPNVVRLAPVALYTSYMDVHRLVDHLEGIALEKEYELYSDERSLVV